jgi:phospholipase/carboxylesterase
MRTSSICDRADSIPGERRRCVPLNSDTLPDLSSVRVWIGAGDQDPIVPASETKRLAELLRGAGADVTLRYFPAGHKLTPADVEGAREWLIQK